MAFLSISRILALRNYYHAPMTIVHFLEMNELPRLLNVTGFLPLYPPDTREVDIPRVDLSPVRQFDLKLCWAKEWHRFPGHYLIPDGISVAFVKSEFNGLLPGHFMDVSSDSQTLSNGWSRPGTRHTPEGLNDLNREDLAHYVSRCCRTLPEILTVIRSTFVNAITLSTLTFHFIQYPQCLNLGTLWMKRRGSVPVAGHSWMQGTHVR